MNDLYLGIDTSMYTTSVSVIDDKENIIFEDRKILEVKIGEKGLRQSVAVFQHLKALPSMLEKIENFNFKAIGISNKPRNVEGSYMPVFKVGESFGEIIAKSLNIPLYRFSHQENHLAAFLFDKNINMDEPCLFIHLSGGTTEILLVEKSNDNKLFDLNLITGTTDISAGQLIDRVGVMLDLPFPAGPYLEILSEKFESEGAINTTNLLSIGEKNGNLSFSGIETRLKNMISTGNYSKELIARITEENIAYTLVKTIGRVFKKYPVKNIIIAGGVASNRRIRKIIKDNLPDLALYYPAEKYASDHSVGVALLAKRALGNLRRSS